LGLSDDQLELHTRRILFSDRLLVDLAAAGHELEALDELARRARRPIAKWYVLVFRAVRATMAGHIPEAQTLMALPSFRTVDPGRERLRRMSGED
jgi:hypothetical protein